MNKTRNRQLSVLLKVAKSEEDRVALKYKDAQTGLLTANKALEDLINYRHLYHSQLLDKSSKAGVSGLSWGQYTKFMASLEHSKVAQLQKVAEEERIVEKTHLNWLKANLHRRKIEILLNKQLDKQKYAEAKQEQKTNDELVTNMFNHKQE